MIDVGKVITASSDISKCFIYLIPPYLLTILSILMKYQFQTMNLTEKNKLTIREMVQYIKSFQDKKDTSESMQQERIETLQQTMNAHEAHFKEFNQPKKVEEIDFSDPKPDPSTFTPIEQILDNIAKT